ncbi:MAG: thiamine phosphate synthase [Anaplasma sp.]
MYIVDGKYLGHKAVAGAVRDLHARTGQDVYAVNVEHTGSAGVDYYFDGEQERKLLYRCPEITDGSSFSRSYDYVVRNVLSATKCKDARDARLDCVVLARACASYVLSGNSLASWGPDSATYEYFPSMTEGFNRESLDAPFSDMQDIGLYPIIPDDHWFEYALRCGVRTIQLRAKAVPIEEIKRMVQRCASLSLEHGVRLIVNDHWDLALEYGAYGVHLGQEDMRAADLEKILGSGVRLGLSTHCYHELAHACFYHPSYVALGPVFHTTSKDMKFEPQGLQLLKQWVEHTRHAVVAVGGINASNIDSVVGCGVKGVAIISAITGSANPENMIRCLLEAAEGCP